MRGTFETSKPERLLLRALRKIDTFPRAKYKIGRDRADIAFPDSRIAVQVTFPDATKQEILEHKQEDKEIEKQGWQVIRFSPKELEDKYSEIAEGIKENVERNKIVYEKGVSHEETRKPLISKEEKVSESEIDKYVEKVDKSIVDYVKEIEEKNQKYDKFPHNKDLDSKYNPKFDRRGKPYSKKKKGTTSLIVIGVYLTLIGIGILMMESYVTGMVLIIAGIVSFTVTAKKASGSA